MLYDPKWEKPAVELTDWQRLLLKAAEIIEQRGHAKDALCDDRGAVCLLGALNVAATGIPTTSDKRRSPALDAMGRHLGFTGMVAMELVDWNNSPERTASDVTSAMRAAAV